MASIGLTRAGILVPVVTFLSRAGAPVERLLVRSGLPEWILDDPEALTPTASTARLLAQAARREGIGNAGLLAGEAVDIQALGLFGRLVRSSPTLGAALDTLVARHRAFSSNGRMWLARRGADVELCQAFGNRFDEEWQQASHYILMLMIGVIRLAAGPAWRPAVVHLQTGESTALRDAGTFADARVDFSQPATTIVVPGDLLGLPMPSFELDAAGVEAWAAATPAGDFAGAIAQLVETLSWDRYPSPRATAALLGVSVRTLQRRLAAAGFSHEELVARARCGAAASLLAETDSRILDIALDLGYSDHAHFTRAFRRWMGCTPRQFRQARSLAGTAVPPDTERS